MRTKCIFRHFYFYFEFAYKIRKCEQGLLTVGQQNQGRNLNEDD